jgi:transcriptional regulator with XRE-family HTH domain
MGMTVQGLASKLHVTEAYVAGVENGTCPVDIQSGLITMFAKELGVTAGYLNGDTPMPSNGGAVSPPPSHCAECARKDALIEKLVASVERLSRKNERRK